MFYRKIKAAILDPLYAGYHLGAKCYPDGLWRRYVRLATEQDCQSLYFVLSFDCDTVEDIDVVEDLHRRLIDIGVHPVYAVPGQLLQKGEKVYQRIHANGGEFINHGFVEHTYFDEDKQRQASCFFYDQVSAEQVAEDVFEADKCLRDVMGIVPRGFRTPHFGTFQRPGNLSYLHGLLKQLNYVFSTSTNPYFAFRYGPLASVNGIIEIPVSGFGSSPLTILDSWACFAAPDRDMAASDYLSEAEHAGRNYQKAAVGILNYYVDPLHVHDKDEFIRAVEFWKSVAEPLNYQELLERVNVVQSDRSI